MEEVFIRTDYVNIRLELSGPNVRKLIEFVQELEKADQSEEE